MESTHVENGCLLNLSIALATSPLVLEVVLLLRLLMKSSPRKFVAKSMDRLRLECVN